MKANKEDPIMSTYGEVSDTLRSEYGGRVVETPSDFRIHTGIYTDPKVFDTEMRNIFHQTWVYVGHESEVRHPGDYRTAYIGHQPVIVSRSDGHSIDVLLNTCRHRGNVVCREEQGNANFFRCAYHGWTYHNDGRLAGIAERRGYPDGFTT
ncbi:MAG: Rieske 2Fe-2S domain-containing protein, partial [Actinobacteria bacterium]|nr:Rieske 2Fe-2S domain-containing protein [Actinomycetota bacterium]